MTPRSLRLLWIALALALLAGWYLTGSPGLGLFRPHDSESAHELDRRARETSSPTPSLRPPPAPGGGPWPAADVAATLPRALDWTEALRRFDAALPRGRRPDAGDREAWARLDGERLGEIRAALGEAPSPTLFLLAAARTDLGRHGEALVRELEARLAERLDRTPDPAPQLTEDLLQALPDERAGAFLERHWSTLEPRWRDDPKLPRAWLARVGTPALLARLAEDLERWPRAPEGALAWFGIAREIEARARDTAHWQTVLVPGIRRLFERGLDAGWTDKLLLAVLQERARIEGRLPGDLLHADLATAERGGTRERILARLLASRPANEMSKEVREALIGDPRLRDR